MSRSSILFTGGNLSKEEPTVSQKLKRLRRIGSSDEEPLSTQPPVDNIQPEMGRAGLQQKRLKQRHTRQISADAQAFVELQIEASLRKSLALQGLDQGGNTCFLSAALMSIFHTNAWQQFSESRSCLCQELSTCPSCMLMHTYKGASGIRIFFFANYY